MSSLKYLIKGTVYSKVLTLNANAILNLYDLLYYVEY